MCALHAISRLRDALKFATPAERTAIMDELNQAIQGSMTLPGMERPSIAATGAPDPTDLPLFCGATKRAA